MPTPSGSSRPIGSSSTLATECEGAGGGPTASGHCGRLSRVLTRFWRVRLKALAACTLAVLAQVSLAQDPVSRSLTAEYDRLLAGACIPEQFDVATPIEARILRNLPFARAGLRLASTELAGLYAEDGDWYRPEQDRVELDPVDQACVERLRRHERRLREQLPIDASVEAVLTRDAGVFWALREHARYPNRYRLAYSHQEAGYWSWGFQDGAACGGDGSPEAAGDCAGFAVICHLEEGDQRPVCELVMSG